MASPGKKAFLLRVDPALWEAIEFEHGRILNPRLSQYRVPRMSDLPEIDVVLLDRRDLPSAGAGETPIIAEQSRRLDSFLAAVADGRVDKRELEDQEQRLVNLMREIEPQLEPAMHEKVTQLLCELTAYDMMNVMNMMQQARPATKFRG